MVEIKRKNIFKRSNKSVFLKVIQQQQGDDQKAFRVVQVYPGLILVSNTTFFVLLRAEDHPLE